MNSRLLLGATTALLTISCSGEDEQQQRPNVLVILADDMGYSDLGCYGGVINTPELDALAENGLRYTQFYNTARSCPSRASLLTGLDPHQAGIGFMVGEMETKGYKGQLNNECVTMADVMKGAGYQTFGVGKWHVAHFPTSEDQKDQSAWPLHRGFDHYYGSFANGSYFDPHVLMRDDVLITPDNDPGYQTDNYYYTNAIGDNAIKYLQSKDDSKPFYMYVAFGAAHWPLQALPEDIAQYKGAFDKGWDALRAEILENMKAKGIISKDAELTHDRMVKPWDKIEQKEFESRCMEVYAAMVSCMDRNIGRIVDQLEASGDLDNTLVLYLQDNGGCAESAGKEVAAPRPIPNKGGDYSPMGRDEVQFDGRYYKTREGKPVIEGYGVMPGSAETFIGYGTPWANVSNTPLRMYKHFIHEGGISTPLIAHWPAGIKARGELRRQPGQLMDIMATCIDVSNADYPKEKNGVAIQPCEGESLVSSFATADLVNPNRKLFWEHQGNRAVRFGDWKAVYRHTSKVGTNMDPDISKWELYNIVEDRTELNDLAKEKPEMVKQMVDAWEEYAVRCRVKPWSPVYR